MTRTLKVLDFIIYWSICLIPFYMGIAPAPMNVFMGFLIAAFLAKKIITKESLFPGTCIDLPIALFFLITCISVFNSVYLRDSLRGGVLRLIQFMFVFFAVADQVKDKKHVNRIIYFCSAGVLLVSLDAIWQVFMGHSFIITKNAPIINLGLVRATSSFKDSNTFGIYLSAIAPLVFGLSIFDLKGVKRAIFASLGLFALIGVLLTYSRPTFLAIYIVFIFFAIVKKNKKMIFGILIITLLLPFLLPQSIKKWAKEVDYNPLRFMCNDDRIAAYRNSFNMIKAHPVIGIGVNTFMKNYKKYKEFPEYRNVVTQDTMYAHNMYLQMTAELGLLGLAIFAFFLFSLFSGIRKIYDSLDGGFLKSVCISLCACIIAFLVNGLTESSLNYSRVALMFWYLCGLSLSLKNFAHGNKTDISIQE